MKRNKEERKQERKIASGPTLVKAKANRLQSNPTHIGRLCAAT